MDVDDLSDEEEIQCPGDNEWDDWEDEVQDIPCFFCQETRSKKQDVILHCYKDHDINFRQLCPNSDQIAYIRLVNFLRVKKPKPEDMKKCNKTEWLNSDEYLKPVDPEDAMLQFDVEDLYEIDLPKPETLNNGVHDDSEENGELLQQLRESQSREAETQARLAQVLEDLERMRSAAQSFIFAGGDGPMTSIQALSKEEDSAYVQPYGHYSIHQEMLQDRVRTESYRDFILGNPKIFKDKIVLDIGCGTGILSLFAAKSGAKKVFAVEQSDIYIQAKDIVHENGYNDTIEIIHGKLEDIDLPVDEVDIIVSEWMGYFLLFESMLDTIIFAREKWLAEDGSVYPDKYTISLCGTSDEALYKNNVQYWDDVYGMKMTCMRDLVVSEAAVEFVKPECLITDTVVVKTIDANTIQIKDVDFTQEFQMKINKAGSITAIVGYFDTIFGPRAEKVVEFSTGPQAKDTHWKQTVFLLNPPLEVKEGQVLEGSILCKKNPKDPRSLKVAITLDGVTRKYVVE